MESQDQRIAREAAEWLLRLDEDPDTDCHGGFVRWLRHSPRHMEAFLLMSATARVARNIDPERAIDVDALLADAPRNVVALQNAGDIPVPEALPKTAGRTRVRLAVAASLLLASLLASYVGLRGNRYATEVGEQRSFQLEDGSLLHLNTRSRVVVRYSAGAREIELVAGEALFVVAKDPARPFHVVAGPALIQALGTEFDVYRRHDGARVSVVEGKVKVISPDRSLAPTLVEGEQTNIGADGVIMRPRRIDVSNAVAWRERRLVFRDAPLEDIAAEFNRYNRSRIVIEPPASARRLTGTFNADAPDVFLNFLRDDSSLELERSARTVVVREREH